MITNSPWSLGRGLLLGPSTQFYAEKCPSGPAQVILLGVLSLRVQWHCMSLKPKWHRRRKYPDLDTNTRWVYPLPE